MAVFIKKILKESFFMATKKSTKKSLSLMRSAKNSFPAA